MSKQQSSDKASVRKRGIKEIIIGVAIAAVGGVVSLISYNTAEAGETYTVYTGVIALGVVYAFKGLYDVAFPAGFSKKKSSSEAVAEPEADSKETVKEED